MGYRVGQETEKGGGVMTNTDKALQKACAFIADHFGSCPLDHFKKFTQCKKEECSDDISACWELHFKGAGK